MSSISEESLFTEFLITPRLHEPVIVNHLFLGKELLVRFLPGSVSIEKVNRV